MITEHARLSVIPGEEEAFENAFRKARRIISTSPGFVSLSLSRSMETSNVYLLLVQWERLEDHTVGFRRSDGYRRWKELLHHFYDPFPTVEHFTAVV